MATTPHPHETTIERDDDGEIPAPDWFVSLEGDVYIETRTWVYESTTVDGEAAPFPLGAERCRPDPDGVVIHDDLHESEVRVRGDTPAGEEIRGLFTVVE